MLCWSSSGDRLSPHYIGQESYIRAPPPPPPVLPSRNGLLLLRSVHADAVLAPSWELGLPPAHDRRSTWHRLSIPSNMQVLSTGMYCFVTILITS